MAYGLDFGVRSAKSGYLRITADVPGTVLQNKLRVILGDKKVMFVAHELLGNFCNPYVPMKSGTLRASMHPTPTAVKWETPYAHYQYMGKVYGPNIPGILENGVGAWRSRKGQAKYPTGRELGAPGIAKLKPVWQLVSGRYSKPPEGIIATYTFGYTTSGTKHHWLDKAMEGGGRRRYSQQLTVALKKEARRLNKTW